MSGYYKDKHRYDDLLDLPHHQSKVHPRMSLHDRAAQFAPFAALTGHEEAIEETARLTEGRIILDETKIEKINEKLAYFQNSLRNSEKTRGEQAVITYFMPDRRKEGGAYLTDIGEIRRIDEIEGYLLMDSGMKIEIKNIVDIRVEH